MFNRDMFGDIHRKRGFTHRGAPSHDDEITALKTRGHAIQVGEARGHTRDIIIALTVIELINTLYHFGQ